MPISRAAHRFVRIAGNIRLVETFILNLFLLQASKTFKSSLIIVVLQ